MIVKQNFRFEYAKEDRVLHIYLPDDYYDAGNEERYAVMYMWDGQNLFNDHDATFGKSWGLAQFLDGLKVTLSLCHFVTLSPKKACDSHEQHAQSR